MADVSSNFLKRLHTEEESNPPHKRPRSHIGSPAPVTNGSAAPAKPDINKIMAEARAKAAAAASRLQNIKGGVAGSQQVTPTTGLPAPISSADRLAQLRARVSAA